MGNTPGTPLIRAFQSDNGTTAVSTSSLFPCGKSDDPGAHVLKV